MTDPNAPLSITITAGLITRAQLMADLHCSIQTLRRREQEGMPVLRIGIQRFYNPAAVRAWFLARSTRQAGDAA